MMVEQGVIAMRSDLRRRLQASPAAAVADDVPSKVNHTPTASGHGRGRAAVAVLQLPGAEYNEVCVT